MRFNFQNNSLKEVFIIQREYHELDMEYFMERLRESLRIPVQYFNTDSNGD